MSKINAIRLININYNNNAIRISDEVLHLNGLSTLISLRNGGGKSVLVQMLTAPFVQKRYRNTKDRPFASYFTTPRPSFILVEWALDQGAGYVLTGMMVRQSQDVDDGEDLDVINFISEYKEPCIQDLHHLPVIEKTRGGMNLKSFASCRQLFNSYKKDRSMQFFCYDMNNSAQSRQYFDKLMEYGINYREWQSIIKKINEEESGLSKLFSDCKDEKGLVEKWFLESVESKLNHDKNRMQEFRDIIEKHICLYRDNQSKIRRRDTIQKFNEESVRIREQGETYRRASDATREAFSKIRAYLQELDRILEETETEYDREKDRLSALNEEIRLLSHQKYSQDYYREEDEIDALKQTIASLEESGQELLAQKDSWTRTLNLMRCAGQQERLDMDRAELARAEAALELCQREGQDLTPEREYLGYRIRCSMEADLQSLTDSIGTRESEIRDTNAREKQTGLDIEAKEQEIRKTSGEEGRLESAVKSYDNEENRFNAHWHLDLARNILGEYDAGQLPLLSKELEKEEDEAVKDRSQKRKFLEDLSVRIRKQERTADDLETKSLEYRQRLSDAENTKKEFDAELEERRKIMQYLGLRDTSPFDRDRLLRAAENKLAELDASVRKLSGEADRISKEIRNLTTGQTVEISPELEDLFENLGIHVVYGMEWMKRNGQTESENLKLVKEHPFLPFALIMSEAELDRLEKAESRVYTSFPLPIVTRESLAEKNHPADGGPLVLGSTHFYMLFNHNLLNEEKLGQLLSEMQRDLKDKQDEGSRRKQEYNAYLIRKNTLLQQKVTESSYQKIQDLASDIKEALGQIREETAEAKQKAVELNNEKNEIAEDLITLDKRLDSLKRESEELSELTSSYAAYLEEKQNLFDCRNRLKAAEEEKAKKKADLERMRGKLHSLEAEKTELQVRYDAKNQEFSAFSSYQKRPRPDTVKEEDLLDMTRILARYHAITEQISRKEGELEKERGYAWEKVQKSEKSLRHLASKYHFEQEEWKEKHYSTAEEDHAEEEIAGISGQIDEIRKTQNQKDTEKALEEERQKHIVSAMQKECGEATPLQREEVPEIDFEGKRSALAQEKIRQEEALTKLLERKQMLEENQTSLAEYQEEEKTDDREWKEDFASLSRDELRAFTGGLKRDCLQSQKNETEARERLVRILNQIIRMPEFQEDFYKKPLEAMISVSGDANQVMEQLDIVSRAYQDLIRKLMADIAIVEEEKAHIVSLLQSYVKQVHEELGKIDRNSTIPVRGRRIKMLKIDLPDWSDKENLYHVRISDLIDTICEKGIEILDQNGSLHEFIGKRMTTKELYDAVVGIGNVNVLLYKIEEQRELQISWNEVARNSGGEGFLSAFVILSSLLSYMRRDDTDVFADRNEGKVLLMDNPFAQTNAAHLLKPLMDVARNNNTQLICLTGLGGDSIYSRFDNIYALNLIPSSLDNGVQHLNATHTRGEDPEVLTTAHLQVSDDDGQMEILF
jgi:hypothetical protein